MNQAALPGLEPVFTIVAEIAPPRSAGPGLAGERLHIPILGGTVEGRRLSGRILPGGSDWPLIRRDGASAIEAFYTIEATDGTLILVRNRGLRLSSPDVLERLRAGAAVDPTAYYFRSTLEFDAPDGPHQWLRENLFVASLAPAGRRITIDVYRLT
ncbi:MAG: DUF3237 domain-containing protein [Phyllobacteriaceae bacterium]|nr:DUF3237 domain-containing protein [Phyllobacteriaceae bacterium]